MSKTIGIVTDTSCDLPQEYFKEHNIRQASMKIHFGDEEFTDQVDLSHEDFYQKMVAEPEALPRTTQPQARDFTRIYQEMQEEGYSTIFSLHLSSKMSGTLQAANLAQEMIEGVEIIPIDTEQVGPALGVFVYLVNEYRQQGADAEEMKQFIQTLMGRNLIFEIFTVNSMKYLVKNGRVGKAKGFAAGLLNIKPILTIKEGEIAPLDKARGSRALFKKMVELGLEKVMAHEKPMLFLTHGKEDMGEEVARVGKAIQEEAKKDIVIKTGRLAPTISCHSGPEVYSLTVADLAVLNK